MDGDGKFCGRDPGYEDYPYLFYSYLQPSGVFPPIWTPWAVCVSECPRLQGATDLHFDCRPTDNNANCVILDGEGYNSSVFLDRWCLPVYNTLPNSMKETYDNVIGTLGLDDLQSYVRDIEKSWRLFLACVGTCLLTIFLYNWMLRCFAEILTWIAIFAVAFGLFGLGWMVREFGAVNYVEGDTT